MHHRCSLPLRWADLDLLGHVNNVRYADYLREARDDLAREAGLDPGPGGLLVRRHALTFRAPLLFGTEPVVVDTWVRELSTDSATLEHSVHDGAADPVTYLRARTVVAPRDGGHEARPFTEAETAALAAYLEPGESVGEPEEVRVRPKPARDYALHVRAGDLDVTGRVSDVAFVEYFQEARIGFFGRLLHELPDTARLRWVVAHTDIDYRMPVLPSRTPYDCSSRLARVGNKSLVVESVIRGEDGTEYAAARVVLVVFDPVTQRATEPPAGYREVLEGLVESA